MNWTTKLIAALCCFLLVATSFAAINRVRVVNDTDKTIYIHKGGYPASISIPAGKWRIFYYPFYVVPPGENKRIASSLLVATAGGKWLTTPKGYTYLHKPTMVICLDYRNAEHAHKTGNRVWTIRQAMGFDPGCQVKGYKQPWHQTQSSSKNNDNSRIDTTTKVTSHI